MNNLIGRKVFVYYNLHKHKWSIRCEKTKLVIGHTDTIVMVNCTFKVSLKGKQRVIKEQRKNVHAGIQGTILGFYNIPELSEFLEVTYNPYKYDSFVYKNSENSIYSTDNIVYMDNKKVYKKFTDVQLRAV